MPTVESQGIRLYFDDSGDGEPLVLLHSFLCSGAMWAPQVPALAKRFRVINIDARGHGESGGIDRDFSLYDMVGDVVAVLDHLEIERAIWAGLSIGGMVALRAALAVPERVSALVLLDTHAGPETAYKKLKYRAMGLGVRALGIPAFLPAVLPLMFGRTTLRENRPLIDEWRARFATVHVPSMLRGLGALVRRDSLVDRLDEIGVPTLVMVGSEDRSLPPPCAEQIAEGIQGASLVVVPGAGHLSTLEQPRAVTDAMLRFLESSAETQPAR